MKNVIAVLAVVVCLMMLGCVTTGSNHTLGACQKNALIRNEELEEKYEVRYGHGSFKGKSHMWCEYKKDGLWLMAKDTIWYVNPGWPIEAYKSGRKYDYKLGWYGYPNSSPDYENEKMLYELGILGYLNKPE